MRREPLYCQSFEIRGRDFVGAGKASITIKGILREIGVPPAVIRRAAIASYEAEMNVVLYARQGTMRLRVAPGEVRVVVEDEGPGIPDIELAMQEGYSTASDEIREMGFGAGMGLSNIQRNADTFAIQSVVGQGTTLEMMFRL
jgi:anti-sigma regulatory factor (Ser/Thr protein kinase)